MKNRALIVHCGKEAQKEADDQSVIECYFYRINAMKISSRAN